MQRADHAATRPADTARVFFALWPSRQASTALFNLARELQDTCGGHIMPRTALHCTLVFLGKVQRRRLADLQSAAARLACSAPFCFSLQKLTCWHRIICAAPNEMPPELADFVAGLRRQITAAGFSFDEKTFVPHVTLLRNIAHPMNWPAFQPLEWRVPEFALVESLSDGVTTHYRTLRRWPLSSSPHQQRQA